MGMFDTVHAGTRCGQTKALGKNLNHYIIGDVGLQLRPAPMDQASFEAYLHGGIAPVADSFQIAMYDGDGYVVVRDTVFTDWVEDPVDDLPVYDGLGRELTAADVARLEAERAAPADPATEERDAALRDLLKAIMGEDVTEPERDCDICAELRTQGADAVRARRPSPRPAESAGSVGGSADRGVCDDLDISDELY